MAETARRTYGGDSIYFGPTGKCRDAGRHRHCPGRWRGVVSLGFDADRKRIRKKVSGSTKSDLKGKLKKLHGELDGGIRSPAAHTVEKAVSALLEDGLVPPHVAVWRSVRTRREIR